MWHLSLSNPRKVYDGRHEQVCVCETPEQAELIVAAVRAFDPAQVRKPAAGLVVGRSTKQEVRSTEDCAFAIV